MIEIGLDLETSGSDINAGAVPIELGLVIDTGGSLSQPRVFNARVGGWDWENEPIAWEVEAEQVHKINMCDLDAEPPAHIVDCMAVAWLWPLVKSEKRINVVPVGWNVAGFDMPFVARYFPQLRALLSYRTVDLNAPLLVAARRDEAEYRKLKKAAKDYARQAAENVGFEQAWHTAWFDAWAALRALEYLRL